MLQDLINIFLKSKTSQTNLFLLVLIQFFFRRENSFADVALPGPCRAPVEMILQVFAAGNRLVTDAARQLFVMLVSEGERKLLFILAVKLLSTVMLD